MLFNNSIDKIIFFKVPSYLFVLIPFFLITGPFLSDLAISLTSIFFLIYCIKYKNFSFFKNKYFYIFLLFYLYLVLNSLFNNFNFDSLKISIFYFRYAFFVIAITALLNYDSKFINLFFYCILICFVSLIFDGFIQYFTGKNLLGWKSTYRTSSFFGDEAILGSYLSRLWPIFFGISIFISKKKNKLFLPLIIILILSEVLIFLSGDRTAFFYINLSAIFVILFSQKLFKLILLILISSIFLLLIISFVKPTAKERMFDQTINQMNLFNSNSNISEKKYIFSKQHTHHYISAYRMYLDHKIFGVGIKNFRKFCDHPKYEASSLSCSTHPHNTYIQILSELGLVGFVFVLIIFFFLKHIIKHLALKLKGQYYFNDFEICILSGIAIYIWPIAPTGNFFNNWLNILMILNFPFLAWSRKVLKDNS